MLLILQGLQTGVLLAVDQEEVYMGLGHEGSNHFTAPIQTPSSQSNLPLAPQPAQPTTTATSTSTPPPLSATHMHPLFSLLPAVCHSSLSLSLCTHPKWPDLSSLSLVLSASLHHSFFLFLHADQPESVHIHLHKLKGSQPTAFPNFLRPKTLFSFLTFFGSLNILLP